MPKAQVSWIKWARHFLLQYCQWNQDQKCNKIQCLAQQVIKSLDKSLSPEARLQGMSARKKSCMLCLQFCFLCFHFALPSKHQHLTRIAEICRKISISSLCRGSINHVYNHSKGIHAFLSASHYTNTYNLEVRTNKYVIKKFQHLLFKIPQPLSSSPKFFERVNRSFHFLFMTKNVVMPSE